MKLKLLLYLIFLAGILYAQEPYRSLIISEVRLTGRNPEKHVEITNMGNMDINLNEFKIGNMRPWIPQPILDPWNDPWVPEADRMFMLPDKVLKPGDSYVISGWWDFGPAMYKKRIPGWEGYERIKQVEFLDLADLLIHALESETGYPGVKDSATVDEKYGDNLQTFLYTNFGSGCFYLEHHFAPGDSAVVDQVGGVFDDNGRNFYQGYDVAGVTEATANSVLVRKYSINTGNLDFANARGVGLEDSEWLPLPMPLDDGYNAWRDLWWTVGNHGPYVFDENTLESDVIEIDFANKILNVPWGVRRLDDIMRKMVKKPGIAWNYHFNSNIEDSLYLSARTGDKLTVHVVGNELQTITFDIVVSEPTADVNIVVPKARMNIASVFQGGPVRTNTQAGIEGLDWPRVTENSHGNDTITGTWGGLPNALRTDSLLKYLEKPEKASWELVWVDNIERPDLKNGDILKVTSENGATKEYFIQVQPYGPSHNANLASITWPDIPDFYKGIFGWTGDTIPNFTPTTFNYRVQVPFDVEGVPALLGKPENLNAKTQVTRAKSLTGTVEDRTISFDVTAEDDSVTNKYNIELVKEKNPQDIQPYKAEPFLSELVFWESWNNSFGEICNPGNQRIDLSDYMIAMAFNTDPAGVIESRMGVDDWLHRYDKYVPGYKWVDQASWAVSPGILELDLTVNPIIEPGDVFCMGGIWDYGYINGEIGLENWQVLKQLDVQFHSGRHPVYTNPWGEEVSSTGTPIRKWNNSSWFLFRILNDSIKLGLKPANDPNDFELIDAFGMSDGSTWVIGGVRTDRVQSYRRKPEIFKGNPLLGASFGTDPDDSEWTIHGTNYYAEQGYGWPWRAILVGYDIGQHYMNEPTHYVSTVSSTVYKVSEGYSMSEEIRGITTGTPVANFIANIIKANENQTLTVKATSDGSILTGDALLSMNDTLIVLSADSTNITKYLLNVSEDGLSSNAILTSNLYEIEITDDPLKSATNDNMGSGHITGFEYGTQLSTVLNNVTVPFGASLDIIDGEGAYIPLKMLNFDTTYVRVTVNSNTYFHVVAEDGLTTIVYQLQPRTSGNDVFILSDKYVVMQANNLIQFVPRGTNAQTLISNLIPSMGATLKVVDKMGNERTEGTIREDDKVVVTSPNGEITRVYHLAMLRTQYIQEPTYLAYVLSNIYQVDQVNYEITGPTGTTQLTEFYSRITPVMGATAVLVDASGDEKLSGELNVGDMLKVTSKDGKIVVLYTLNLGTSAVQLDNNQVEIYPNPTNGKLNVRGVEQGNRIQVFTASGVMVRDIRVQSNLEVLSIDDQPAGLFLIIISDKEKVKGRFKAVKN